MYMKTILFFIGLIISSWVNAEILDGKVVKIVDGDTVDILLTNNTTKRIRLAGIDTPEIRPTQPFGKAAKRHIAALIGGEMVTVEWNKKDRWGRIIGKISLDGTDICLAMIKDGYAWHYKKYKNEQSEADQVLYADAEVRAKREKNGLFSDPNSLPPWEFRKR